MHASAPTQRDYNTEYQDNSGRHYFYDFDARLRTYMLQTFRPLMPSGKALEMGCFKGAFTQLLVDDYPHLEVLEAASDLIEVARATVPETVVFHHDRFESFQPEHRYECIFLIHTLEHLDDPVAVLRRVRHWLTPTGKLFLAVPNANAASRQLAVKMGLLSHHAVVTEAERLHGHRLTYSLDTLERDARAAGLSIASRGGVFFKPLANAQFDKLMQTDIISDAYLDACYALGQHYPDLCASVYVVCTPGDEA